MTIRFVLMVATMVVASLTLRSQDFSDEIKVGQRLPISELNNMINYPTKTLRFANHKPKLTILDFWGTTCGGCVTAWPKLLSLQKEFGADLQIILVDRFEDEKLIRNFVTNRKKKAGVDMILPISCNDTTLRKFFPRMSVPRYCWVDSNGILSSVTHGDQVNSTNIRKWIETGPLQLDQIIDEMIKAEGNKPLFVDGNGGTGRSDGFIWNSILTKSFWDIAGMSRDFTNSISGYGICKTGATIDNLYRTAYNNRLESDDYFTWLHESRRELIAKDTSKYFGFINGAKDFRARYNYQLIAGRPMTRQELQTAMQEDLKRYFGLIVSWERRKKACLVLTMFDSTKAKAKTRGEYNAMVGETQTFIDNARMHEVVFYMEQGSFFYDRRPIVDETGFKGLLTGIYFDAYCKDIAALDKGFSKFGIHLRQEIREVDVLVMREPGTSD